MRCHYITDKKTGNRVFIPECMGAAAMGKENCTCRKAPLPDLSDRVSSLEEQVKELKTIIQNYEKNIN